MRKFQKELICAAIKENVLSNLSPSKTQNMDSKKIMECFQKMFEEFKSEMRKQLADQREFFSSEMKYLREELAKKDRTIESLQDKVDDLEQYSRRENIIITGLQTRKRQYNNVANPNPAHTPEEVENLEAQVLKFMASRDIHIKPEEISDIHPLRSYAPNRPAPIIIRFVSRKKKSEVLRNGKKLKGSDVYINDHLTAKNQSLAKRARQLRYEKKIDSTWTKNGQVLVKVQNGNQVSIRSINHVTDFNMFV